MRHSRLPLVALAIAMLSASLCHGLSYVLVRDHHLARQADLIVRGEILSTATSADAAFTDIEVRVLELVKGQHEGTSLEFRTLGGSDPDGRYFNYHPGTPDFASGQRVLLFLWATTDGSYRILHVNQGVFWEVVRSEKSYFLRPLPEEYDTILFDEGQQNGFADLTFARQGRGFLSYLRDGSFPEIDMPDYMTALPKHEADSLVSDWTLIGGGGGSIIRWFVWDSASPTIKFKRQKKTKIRGGTTAAKKAAKVWGKKSKSGIKMTAAGKTSARGGLGPADGVNSIQFRDLNGVMPTFSCAVGGILGRGGPKGRSPLLMFKGRAWFQTTEVDVALADGLKCFGDELKAVLQAVLTHEIGHTLALGHSCGDSTSPKCSSDDALDKARMNAKLGDVLGAKIFEDDKDAAAWLYGKGDQVPCVLAKGHKNFCKKCGPCGKGQGSCSSTKQCGDGLKCKKNAGGDFGLAPKVDVCVSS